MINPNHEEIILAVVRAIMNAYNRIHNPKVSGVNADERINAKENVMKAKMKDILEGLKLRF